MNKKIEKKTKKIHFLIYNNIYGVGVPNVSYYFFSISSLSTCQSSNLYQLFFYLQLLYLKNIKNNLTHNSDRNLPILYDGL